MTHPSAPDVERVADKMDGLLNCRRLHPLGSVERETMEQATILLRQLAARPRAAEVQRLAETEYQESDLVRLARPPAPDGDGTTVGAQPVAQLIADIHRYACFDESLRKLMRRVEAALAALPVDGGPGGWNAAIEAAAKVAEDTGNFGDYKREELTADYGQPGFDMMHKIIFAIRALARPAGETTNGC